MHMQDPGRILRREGSAASTSVFERVSLWIGFLLYETSLVYKLCRGNINILYVTQFLGLVF